MIKRIIFDLDNTLIMWKKEYIFALKNVLDKLGIIYTEEQLYNFDKAVESYEKKHDKYYNDSFLEHINNECQTQLPKEFTELLIEEQGKCFEDDKELIDTIKYLSTKYDLVILSNWFTKTQKLRLENAHILKYFSIVTGGDEHLLKPNSTAFNQVLEGCEPQECLMVGDSLEQDIIPAQKLNINVIWVTKEKTNDYKTIKNIYELKNIL